VKARHSSWRTRKDVVGVELARGSGIAAGQDGAVSQAAASRRERIVADRFGSAARREDVRGSRSAGGGRPPSRSSPDETALSPTRLAGEDREGARRPVAVKCAARHRASMRVDLDSFRLRPACRGIYQPRQGGACLIEGSRPRRRSPSRWIYGWRPPALSEMPRTPRRTVFSRASRVD